MVHRWLVVRYLKWAWANFLKWPVLALGPPFFVLWLFGWIGFGREPQVRLAGMSLQLLGIVLVVVGLVDNHRRFNLPNFWKYLREAWERRPGLRAWLVDVSSPFENISLFARGTIKHSSPDATVEKRLVALEANVDALFAANANLANEAERKITVLTDQAKRIEQRLDHTVEEFDRLVKDSVVGDFSRQWLGVCWLILGTLGSASPEIAYLWP